MTKQLLVEHSDRLTSIFGHWPSFHDAEITDLRLCRGQVHPDRGLYIFPVLTVKVHLWALTDQTGSDGFLVRKHHTLATLRFQGLEDDLELFGFNQQNVISGLTVANKDQQADGPAPLLAVAFGPCFGMSATFTCRRAEVLEALPCNDRGEPLSG